VKIPDNLTEDQVKIGSVSMVGGSATENGKEISSNLPGVQIYIGNKDWTSIMEITPLVDLKEKRVVRI